MFGGDALPRDMRIGVDFDNTIADYDDVFVLAAQNEGFLGRDFVGDKQAVRTALRALDRGEEKWMRLQGKVYGALMPHARLIEGFDAFLLQCRKSNIPAFIISHKTVYGHYDEQMVNLQDAARSWMTDQGFFGRYGLPGSHVFFETSRSEKIGRIRATECTHFIDDLVEVFLEPQFPPNVHRYLLSRGTGALPTGPFTASRSWRDICDVIFD